MCNFIKKQAAHLPGFIFFLVVLLAGALPDLFGELPAVIK